MLAGQLAELWPGLEPRESVIAAAALHDCGWRVWEASPRFDAETGRPQNFLGVDIDLHLKFYELGIMEVTAARSLRRDARGQAPRRASTGSATARRPR